MSRDMNMQKQTATHALSNNRHNPQCTYSAVLCWGIHLQVQQLTAVTTCPTAQNMLKTAHHPTKQAAHPTKQAAHPTKHNPSS
jgi:hypothetical protein